MKTIRRNLGIIVGVIFLAILFFHDRLSDYDQGRYQDTPPQEILNLNKIKFKEVSQTYGLEGAKHNLYSPNKNPVVKKYLPFLTVRPYVSVVDINQDGYMDLFFLETLPDKPSRLYLNQKGKGFQDITDQYIDLLSQKGERGTSISAWADFNNDGKLDFFTADAPCFSVFLQTGKLKFKKVEEVPDYCSIPSSLNLFDFNRDGNLDVGVGNYFSPRATKSKSTVFQQLIGLTSVHAKGGEPNVIFLGDGKGRFEVFQPEELAKDVGRTTTFGVSYINEDQWPDFFVGNDYTFDEMYLNKGGKDLENVTDYFIPRNYHGFSGMSSDFADFNLDGQLDLFVTNGWGPPSAVAENLLWQKGPEGKGFIEQGRFKKVFKCGWAWGAKFADFDLDGDLDLFVTNGRTKGKKAKSFNESRSVNFLRTQVRSMPTFFRQHLVDISEKDLPDMANSDFQYYGFERNCLFMQHEGEFYDVAQFSGVDDLENGRSVVTLDIENDGKIDVAIGNTDGPLLLYNNESETRGNWVGFSLENRFGLPYHGASIFALRSDNKPLKKELFVGNGGRGMNDPRIHFGLGDYILTNDGVTVLWPDGKFEKFRDVKLNTYNRLRYGEGEKG